MTTEAPPAPAVPREKSRRRDDRGRPVLAAIVAVAAVGISLICGWHGVDTAASVHRIDEFRRYGYSLWDASWYGGQWTLDYSIVFAPVASTLGLPVLALIDAAVAAYAFQALLDGPGGRLLGFRSVTPPLRRSVVAQSLTAGSAAKLAAGLVFAVSLVVATSIGQLPYLSGQAVGLAALAAAARGRWVPAWVLALVASLFSPLAGLFVALAAATWALTLRRHPRKALAVIGLAVAVAIPVLATTVLFAGEGQMPFDLTDCLWDVGIAVAVWIATPREYRTLRIGIALYAVALLGSWAVPSPIGGNMGRLGDQMALPVAVLVLWSRQRVVLGLLAIPLFASSWGPGLGAIEPMHAGPDTTAAFYQPLDRWLSLVDPGGIDGRVEVVPTRYHWEAVWVANVVPLARGWERQSDVTLNPIFYRPGPIPGGAYRRWLLENGVRWVALPRGPLDYGGTGEAAAIKAGVPGLAPVWHNANWQVYQVAGSTGLVSDGATVTSLGNSTLTIRADGAGTFTVRVRGSRDWHIVAGAGCLTGAGRSWLGLQVPKAEEVALRLSLGGASTTCRERS